MVYHPVYMSVGTTSHHDDALPPANHYRRIADQLRTDILEGLWRADVRLKVRDLAAHYGVRPGPSARKPSAVARRGAGRDGAEPGRPSPAHRRATCHQHLRRARGAGIVPHGQIRRQRLTSPDSLLEALQAEHDAAVEHDDFAAAFSLNGRFHLMINSAARNPEALGVIERHLGLTRALRVEYGFTPARLHTIQREHHQLLDALRRTDVIEARRIAALARQVVTRRPAGTAESDQRLTIKTAAKTAAQRRNDNVRTGHGDWGAARCWRARPPSRYPSRCDRRWHSPPVVGCATCRATGPISWRARAMARC